MVERLFLTVPRGCLRFVIVVFPDHTHLLFLINNVVHSMFSGIDLYINNILISNYLDTYPYKAYLKTLFSYGAGVKYNQLKAAEFWSEDEPGVFENMSNSSITDHGKRVAKSKPVDLQGKLHLELAMQERYLPTVLEFKHRFNRSSPQFCLLSDDSPAKKSKLISLS